MNYTQPKILTTNNATASIMSESGKAGISLDNNVPHQTPTSAYEADE
jgi:hypothetical protein